MELNDFFDCIQTAADDSHKDSFAAFQEAQIVALIKTAEESVRTCFFPNDSKPNVDAALVSDFAELSVKYMCYGIGMLPGAWKDTVQNCTYSVVGDWFKAHDDLGEKLLISYLAAHKFNLATNTDLMKAIVKRLCEKDFLLTETAYAKSKMNDQPKMLLAVVHQCAPKQYEDVRKAWSDAFPGDLLQQLTGRPWFGKYQQTDTLFQYYLHTEIVLDLVGVVCDAIPIVGAICMLVGFIFSIAAMIVKENSDPPMILFIKKEIVPFLKKLPVPPVSAARYKLAPFAAV